MNDSSKSPRCLDGDSQPRPIAKGNQAKFKPQLSAFLGSPSGGSEVFLNSAERKLARLFREESEEYCFNMGLEALQALTLPSGFSLDPHTEIAAAQGARPAKAMSGLRRVESRPNTIFGQTTASDWFQCAHDYLPRPRTLLVLGLSCLAEGKPESAAGHFRRAIRGAGRSSTGYSAALNLGMLHAREERWRKARACYRWVQKCGYSNSDRLQQQAAGLEWVAGKLEGAALAVLRTEARVHQSTDGTQVEDCGNAAQTRYQVLTKELSWKNVGVLAKKI